MEVLMVGGAVFVLVPGLMSYHGNVRVFEPCGVCTFHLEMLGKVTELR